MFNAGMKKGTICKQLHLNIDLLDKWIICSRKDMVLKMYLTGTNKNYLSKITNTKMILINSWVNEYMKIKSTKKDIVLKMFLEKYPKSYISKKLNIKNYIVDFWIDEFIKNPDRSFSVFKTNGYSNWVDKLIYKSNKKS